MDFSDAFSLLCLLLFPRSFPVPDFGPGAIYSSLYQRIDAIEPHTRRLYLLTFC
ncbi:MAG: hypothetical protein JWM83_1182 [Candidatus Angelobacter sp.]|jgi:hypothetical protein|nr:hypothetical protein [Candidatus Angelobacter sp.]